MFTFHTFLLFFITFLQKVEKVIPATFQLLGRSAQKVGYVSKVDDLEKYTYLEVVQYGITSNARHE